MIDLADHRMASRQGLRRGRQLGKADSDDEVLGVHEWLRDRAERIERGEKIITYRELRRILARFGFEIENAGQNSAEVVRYVKVKRGILRRREELARQKIATIGYRDEGTTVAKGEVKRIRQDCKLTEEDGCDSQSFYSTGERIGSFVLRYRRVLRRLGRR